MDISTKVGIVKQDAGVLLRLRVQPGASREKVLGLYGGRIRIGVHPHARDGAANRALIRLLSRVLRVRPSCITITAGERSRDKEVLITADLPEKDILSRLDLSETG